MKGIVMVFLEIYRDQERKHVNYKFCTSKKHLTHTYHCIWKYKNFSLSLKIMEWTHLEFYEAAFWRKWIFKVRRNRIWKQGHRWNFIFFLITCFLGIVTIYIYTYIHICSNKYDNLRRN